MTCKGLLRIALLSMAIFVLTIPSYAQTTWIVDQAGGGDFTTIQDCIYEMVDGDTCLVMPGVYTENIDYLGMDITLRSDMDGDPETLDIAPETTIIDGDAAGPVVIVENGETEAAVLNGFTIRNGAEIEFPGAGIHCNGSTITVFNCMISGNHGYGIYANSPGMDLGLTNSTVNNNDAGGLYAEFTNLLVNDSTILGNEYITGEGIFLWFPSSLEMMNSTISGHAVGIYCDLGVSVTLNNCAISDNGWGISDVSIARASRSEMTIINSHFSGNDAGIHVDRSSMTVSGCEFVDNDRGIHFERGDLDISNSRISENNGDGMYFEWAGGPATVKNCIILDNGGNGINCQSGRELTIENSTISGNSGYGLRCYVESSATILNSILYGDSTPDQPEIFFHSSSTVTVLHSNIQMEDPEDVWPGTENINADPLFVAGPEGCYYLSHLATGYPMNSPCIDKGSDVAQNICFTGAGGQVCMSDLTTCIDHIYDLGIVDMGYHHGNDLYVPCPPTVLADLTCTPSTGTIPFDVTIEVRMTNIDTGSYRRFAGIVELDLAGGQYYSNYKQGYTNSAPGSVYSFTWIQAYDNGWVSGDNTATLFLEDVTPAPYNQPPYPPAGDTDTATCTVTGIAP